MKTLIIPIPAQKYEVICPACGRWQGGKTRPTVCGNPSCSAPLPARR